MKKIMAVLSLCSVFAMALAFAGCSGEQTFEAKNWESGDTVVKSVAIDVEDRAVEVIPSEDGRFISSTAKAKRNTIIYPCRKTAN